MEVHGEAYPKLINIYMAIKATEIQFWWDSSVQKQIK